MIENIKCDGCNKLLTKNEFCIKDIGSYISQKRFICNCCDAWVIFDMKDNKASVNYKINHLDNDYIFNMDFIKKECYIIDTMSNNTIYINKDFTKINIDKNSAKDIIVKYMNIL